VVFLPVIDSRLVRFPDKVIYRAVSPGPLRNVISESQTLFARCKFIISILDGPEKNYRAGRAAVLGDLGEVSSELAFFDDEKPIFIRLNQPEVMKSLHKQADPRPRRAHHLGQFFV
jgi:hypothetical protein